MIGIIKKIIFGLSNKIAHLKLLKKKGFVEGDGSNISYRNINMPFNNKLHVGDQCIIEGTLHFDKADASIIIGNRTFIGGGTSLLCSTNISIGNDVLIAWGCTILDHNSHSLNWQYRQEDVLNWFHKKINWDHIKQSPITIGDKVWIGFNCIILKGVTIGEGAVIAAGSVITKDVEPYSVVGGNPQRVLKQKHNEL
jgi:acetyltransferase-like isoleucine patch superfamily enzyme